MATYVMSDLHGSYDGYISILEQINFSNEDILYVDGDVIDRGRDGLKIILDVLNGYLTCCHTLNI